MTIWLISFGVAAVLALCVLIWSHRSGSLNRSSVIIVLAVVGLATIVTISKVRDYRAQLASDGVGQSLTPSGSPAAAAAPWAQSAPVPSSTAGPASGAAAPAAVQNPYSGSSQPTR